jgi:hypothetical protein
MAAFAAAALSFVALPGAAAAYPPQPPEQSIRAGAVATICENDAPYISYEILTDGFDPAEVAALTATVTVLDRDGNIVDGPRADQPLSGKLLYPGAEVDENGKGSDWPGWMQNSEGMWVPDPADDHLRSGLRLNAVVNPEVTAAVQYPAESAVCMSPPGATPPSQSPQGATRTGQLPDTGGSPWGIIWIAAASLLAGAAIWAISSRRPGAAKPSA